MKKIGIAVATAIALFILISFLNPRMAGKRHALGSVGHSLVTANHHHGMVLLGGRMVMDAEFNLPVIARATEYMGHFGTNTGVYRQIAEIAAEADCECLRLEDVLDLAVRKESDTPYVLELARRACTLTGPEEEEAWQQAYESLLATAEYASLDEAMLLKQ